VFTANELQLGLLPCRCGFLRGDRVWNHLSLHKVDLEAEGSPHGPRQGSYAVGASDKSHSKDENADLLEMLKCIRNSPLESHKETVEG